ncbi:MAG TPA: hypothetical protein PK095_21480, partial [Myxococcota bacterium]|nr:hypothetical protein [Myxococcota bacterium]
MGRIPTAGRGRVSAVWLALAFWTSWTLGASGGCSGQPREAETQSGLHVAVAPLSLGAVVDADYTIAVTNGPGGGGQLVWQRSVKSSQYGDGAGSLSYVGPCDGSAGLHTVTLTLSALYDAGGLISADTWENPTPVSLEVPCQPNQDTLASFDLTVMRDARQGFFDVAVEFDDIFCSAKLDCVDGSGDLELLHNPDDGQRDLTAVVGFACAGDVDGSTWLWMDDPVITCTGLAPAQVTFGAGALGNVDLDAPATSNPGGYLFGAAVYRGRQANGAIAYWNLALGLRETAFQAAGSCTLTLRATATDDQLTRVVGGFELPRNEVYPVIDWQVPLSTSAGRSCSVHQLGGGNGVQTAYVGYVGEAATRFQHGFERVTQSVVSACAIDCPLEHCAANGACAEPTCFDFLENGDETGPDCGGGCGPCAAGEGCLGVDDCQSAVCDDGVCAAPSCVDTVHNGDETATDCGGPCAPCADGLA